MPDDHQHYRNQQFPQLNINQVWHSNDPILWEVALRRYWCILRPHQLKMEREMERLTPAIINQLQNPQAWYQWLYHKYFVWKYTAPNRLATTRQALTAQFNANQQGLWVVRQNLLNFNLASYPNIGAGLTAGLQTANQIGGLGVAGASGLLALLLPADFATVDQFVVLGLQMVQGLPAYQAAAVNQIENPQQLNLANGSSLIQIMRAKAAALQNQFNDPSWTPRMIDKILWSCR